MSPVLVQRAVSEDPRWTRAVGDNLVRPQGERRRAVVVRRAQSRIDQATLERENGKMERARSKGQP